MHNSRTPMVAGNWKMNGDLVTNEHLLAALRNTLNRSLTSRVDVVVCPPAVYLGQVTAWVGDTGIGLGAQNVASTGNGAFTGETSAAMLADLGCRWCLVGHSERRVLLGESDDVVGLKLGQLVQAGIGAIACVGESLSERESDTTSEVISRQIAALMDPMRIADPQALVVAYEPVWAIGTGRTATAQQVQEVHAQIRAQLRQAGLDADGIRILYGGSVKPANAAELFGQADVDGGLIGGASLVAEDFTAICRAALG
jgi:triosephosphate isomerase (TIM)